MARIKSKHSSESKSSALGARPEFYLVYLLFYFVPWVFNPPTTQDVIAIVIALFIFLPIYILASKDSAKGGVHYVVVMALIGYALSPFNGSFGVFHIYATVQASLARPERRAWIGMTSLALVFIIFSVLTDQHPSLWVFPVVIGLMVGVSTIYSAEQVERQAVLERSREHDTHMAALAERERIAQDLHDLLGQTLTVVALKSDIANKLIDRDPQRAKQEIIEIREASRIALSEVREAVANMIQTTIAREISRAKTMLQSAGIELEVSADLPELNANAERTIGLAIRESATNIVRHSNATSAKLTLSQAQDGLEVVIEDNGNGVINNEGAGIRGLRKRINALGGVTHIDTNSGVRLKLNLPDLDLLTSNT